MRERSLRRFVTLLYRQNTTSHLKPIGANAEDPLGEKANP
jgi:hypothetical protein